MSRRHYVDNAPTTTLTGSINNTSDVSFGVVSLTGFPSTLPWPGTLDRGTASAEQVLVTNVVGTTVTVTRNSNGQGKFSHNSGATFEHTANAIEYDEANAHVNATTDVHGVVGALVDTSSTQTLSNKSLSGGHVALATASGTSAVVITTDNNTTKNIQSKNSSGTTTWSVDGTGNEIANNVTAAAISATSLATTAGATVGTTLGVTGATTLAALTATTGHFTGTTTHDGNATFGGTLGVTGTTTAAAVNATSVSTTANASIGGTLGVTGATTLAGVTATTVHATGAVTMDAAASVGTDLTVTGNVIAADVRVTPVDTSNPGTVQNSFAEAGSIAKTLFNGKVVHLVINVTNPSTITATNGNVADVICYNVPAGFRPTTAVPGVLTTGAVTGGCVLSTAGNVAITSASDNIASSSSCTMSFTFIKD